MGIRTEIKQKETSAANDLDIGDTFTTLKEREPHIVSNWDDGDEDIVVIAISLLTGKSKCLDHFGVVIPTNFIITEDIKNE